MSRAYLKVNLTNANIVKDENRKIAKELIKYLELYIKSKKKEIICSMGIWKS